MRVHFDDEEEEEEAGGEAGEVDWGVQRRLGGTYGLPRGNAEGTSGDEGGDLSSGGYIDVRIVSATCIYRETN